MSLSPGSLPLRDIHLPPPVSWWPPAPGWWLLVLLLIILVALAWWWHRRWRARALQRVARRAFANIAADYGRAGDTRQFVESLSVLLRRVGISAYPREDVAGLVGEAWLSWLDRGLGGREFSQGAGRALIEAPYNPRAGVDAEALLALCERWLTAITRAGGRRC